MTMHRHMLLLVVAVWLSISPAIIVSAQSGDLPGVRGTLYESPSFGWILFLPGGTWRVAESDSSEGLDYLHLTSTAGDGADHYFQSYPDDGRGAAGCIDDTVALLADISPDQPLEGWSGEEIDLFDAGSDRQTARVRIVDPVDPDFDILALIQCSLANDGLLIADALVQSARDMEALTNPLTATPLLPGEGHTGRARLEGTDASPTNGVVRFLARGNDPLNAQFPFSCIHQEEFDRPADPPPPGTGFFACDGQIANIDIVPASVDLADLAMGCASAPAAEARPPECPDAPIRPSHAEILRAPATDGSVVTLQPGESADVVVWFSLPEGDPPLDVLYLEPDRQVVVGPSFFSAGTGSRPKVRIGR